MPTRTIRVFEDDAHYARILAGLLGLNSAEFFHAALEDYSERVKPELDARFTQIQEAVLSGDWARLRAVFLADVTAQVERSGAAIAALIASGEEITVADDPDPEFGYGDPDEFSDEMPGPIAD
jgi:hypothetical protein